VLVCPNCGEYFGYGYPCIHELILKLLWQGRWKCANCGKIIISDCQVIQLTDEQMDKIAEEYRNASL